MILHTVNKPAALTLCLPMLQSGDTVLLIEDGVLLALDQSALQQLSHCAIKTLGPDVDARGLAASLKDIATISYEDFVSLSVEADKVCAWF